MNLATESRDKWRDKAKAALEELAAVRKTLAEYENRDTLSRQAARARAEAIDNGEKPEGGSLSVNDLLKRYQPHEVETIKRAEFLELQRLEAVKRFEEAPKSTAEVPAIYAAQASADNAYGAQAYTGQAVTPAPEILLARMVMGDLGIAGVNAQALRVFIRTRWDRVAVLAHRIHEGK
ncbi:hypothetical protein [Bradyrhizobium cenepequi]|uniref:hypothetical protein n=1 Tax=Bradyrhizobium cenepequi TaxID=2821403 RepID=UPI001CE25B2A|nr:hypothetical protein [Bradyrhizobium cenepequi]MCA6108124.1 hypothetical protein [Bradyrhizobium cenepequi]